MHVNISFNVHLQNVNAPPRIEELDIFLEITTYVGGVLSLIGLAISIFTMLAFK